MSVGRIGVKTSWPEWLRVRIHRGAPYVGYLVRRRLVGGICVGGGEWRKDEVLMQVEIARVYRPKTEIWGKETRRELG